MDIYKEFHLGMICFFTLQLFEFLMSYKVKRSGLHSVPVHKRIIPFPFVFIDKFLWNGVSSLEWIC